MMSPWRLGLKMKRRMRLTSLNKSGKAMKKLPERSRTGQGMRRHSLLLRGRGLKLNRGHRPQLPADSWSLLLRSPGTRCHRCHNLNNNRVQSTSLWTSWRVWCQGQWQPLRVRTPFMRLFTIRPQHWHKWSGVQELSRRRTWRENQKSTIGAGG